MFMNWTVSLYKKCGVMTPHTALLYRLQLSSLPNRWCAWRVGKHWRKSRCISIAGQFSQFGMSHEYREQWRESGRLFVTAFAVQAGCISLSCILGLPKWIYTIHVYWETCDFHLHCNYSSAVNGILVRGMNQSLLTFRSMWIINTSTGKGFIIAIHLLLKVAAHMSWVKGMVYVMVSF